MAAGADSRIRVWQISDAAVETTNPMLDAHFAHEGTILRLVLSSDGHRLLSCADDRSVKLWDANELKQVRVWEKQSDWASAAAFLDDNRIVVGRMDGSLDFYDASTGEVIANPVLKAEAK
jgi:WD40 repeat protein